jgi:hypothetical protein
VCSSDLTRSITVCQRQTRGILRRLFSRLFRSGDNRFRREDIQGKATSSHDERDQ